MITGPLLSKRYKSPDEFALDFLKTITPGVIPRSEFFAWDAIELKMRGLLPQLEFYTDLAARVREGADFVREFTDSLLASDDAAPLVCCAFELLGHTAPAFVTTQDDLEIEGLCRAVAEGDAACTRHFAEMLRDLGFLRILSSEDLEDLLLGVQIGLETHRRKNVGGRVFAERVASLLDSAISRLAASGCPVTVTPETKIQCGGDLSKKVDFALSHHGSVRFGVEVNFYTVEGSKLTEIKRSYGDVLRRIKSEAVDLIWITDGKGYRRMRQSLRDAFTILPNIYNLRQATAHLADDLLMTFPRPARRRQ